jgi:hypothetical protein
VNKLFAVALFLIGVALITVGACGNLVLTQAFMTGATPMNSWGIIWRIGLGLLLIILAVVLNNMETFGRNKDPFD